MQDAVVLVTGANSGIGKETAKALAAAGATTVLACRDRDKAERAAHDIGEETGNKAVHTACVDLGDLTNVAACAQDVVGRFERIDVLVNNAGGYWDVRATTAQGFEQHFGVNYLSHYLLTRRILSLSAGASPRRVVNVTSVGHRAVPGMNWDDLQFAHGWTVSRAYGQSKLAQILFARELARRFGDNGLVAHAAHPGVVRSNFAQDGDTSGAQHLLVRAIGVFGVSPRAGARTSVHLASSAQAARSNGDYWVRRKRHRPSKGALDAAAARRLWDVSESLVTGVGVAI